MAFPTKLLGEGEKVVLDLRTHWKVLIIPGLILVVIAALLGGGFALVPQSESWTQWVRWAMGIAAAIAAYLWVVMPFIQWLTSSYTITSERLVTRTGIINRTGRDIPLGRVNDVAFAQSIFDRMFGCGTLTVSAASEQGSETLRDVPHVSQVQLTMSELVRETHGWSSNQRHGVTPINQRPATPTEPAQTPLGEDIGPDGSPDEPRPSA